MQASVLIGQDDVWYKTFHCLSVAGISYFPNPPSSDWQAVQSSPPRRPVMHHVTIGADELFVSSFH